MSKNLLLVTHYSLLITHYSLLITHYSLLITYNFSPALAQALRGVVRNPGLRVTLKGRVLIPYN
jgi:hypothetical protein